MVKIKFIKIKDSDLSRYGIHTKIGGYCRMTRFINNVHHVSFQNSLLKLYLPLYLITGRNENYTNKLKKFIFVQMEQK